MTQKEGHRPKKQQTSSSTGLIIGLMFGFLIGLAMFKHTPKSTRSSFFPYAVGLGLILTTAAGYKIGTFTDDQNYRDECLGIHKITTQHLKEEMNWAIASDWQEHDGKTHRILTTLIEGELVTIYNGTIIASHGSSGTSRSAAKLHEEIKTEIIQRLKDGFVE